MNANEHKAVMSALATIDKAAHKALDATNEDEETMEQADARDYLWRILDLVEEAQGQWWAS